LHLRRKRRKSRVGYLQKEIGKFQFAELFSIVFSTGIFELIQPQKQPPCGVAVFIYDPVDHSRFAWKNRISGRIVCFGGLCVV
jgi:hypothetical protein